MSDGFTLKLRFHPVRHKAVLAAVKGVTNLQFRRAILISWATKALRQHIPDSTYVPQHVPADIGVLVKLHLVPRDAPELIRHVLAIPLPFRAPSAVELVASGFNITNEDPADPQDSAPAAVPAPAQPRPPAPPSMPRAVDPDHQDLDVVADFEKGSQPMMNLLGDWED